MQKFVPTITAETWKKTLSTSNSGQRYCVNPYLYQEIIRALYYSTSPINILDIGAGNCDLAHDVLTLATKHHLLGHIGHIHCLEDSYELLGTHIPHPQIFPQQFTCTDKSILPFATNSISIVTSRMVLMHFDENTLTQHLQEVQRVLYTHGSYILAITNPDFEEQKVGRPLQQNVPYLYPSKSSSGEFYHIFKTRAYIEEEFQKYFTIEQIHHGIPLTNDLKENKPQYYSTTCPMALIYHLQPIL